MIVVFLTGNNGDGKYAVISDEDEGLSSYKWHLGSDGYARRKASKEEVENGSPVNIAMHRQVLGLHNERGMPGQPDVDHKNGDRLDNQRGNLRRLTRSENNLNRSATVGLSRYVGVGFFRPAGLWRAYITVKGKRVDIGYFKSEDAAYQARLNYERVNGLTDIAVAKAK